MPQILQTTACVYARTPLWRAGSTSGPAPGRAAGIPSADLLRDFDGAQARVGTKQKRQGQFQAVAQRAQIFTDQRQSGIGGEVAGKFLDNKSCHVKLTFRVNGACGQGY